MLLFDKPWPRQDQLSQKNVLLQLHHLQSYELVRIALKQNRLHLHGWWFDIEEVAIYAYNQQEIKFKVIDEAEAETIQSLLTGSD